jgi:hypothetical protein
MKLKELVPVLLLRLFSVGEGIMLATSLLFFSIVVVVDGVDDINENPDKLGAGGAAIVAVASSFSVLVADGVTVFPIKNENAETGAGVGTDSSLPVAFGGCDEVPVLAPPFRSKPPNILSATI